MLRVLDFLSSVQKCEKNVSKISPRPTKEVGFIDMTHSGGKIVKKSEIS
jgi:hypothetical protein